MRALEALENGDHARIAAEAAATPLEEVRAILELTLEHPDQIEPTARHSDLKRRSVDNSPLPRLDLVRTLATALRLEQPFLSPALNKASPTRPTLDAALDVLLARELQVRRLLALEKCSPRLRAYFSAAMAASKGLCGPLRQLAGRVALDHDLAPGELDPERWPKLDNVRPVQQSKQAPKPTPKEKRPKKDPLIEFLRAPTKKVWTDACERLLDAQFRAPEAEVHLTLGRLLVAIHELVSSARPVEAAPVAMAAAKLQRRIPPSPLHALLEQQLQQIMLRLKWWAEHDRAGHLDWVLETLAPLPIEVVRGLAYELLEIARPGRTPEPVVRKLMLLHVTHPGAISEAGLREVTSSASALPRRDLEAALRDVGPMQRGLMGAAHSMGCDEHFRACAELLEGWLALDPEASPAERRTVAETATRLFHNATVELPTTPPRRGEDRRRLSAALTRFLAASVRGEVQPSLGLHADITVVLGSVHPKEGLDAYKLWLRTRMDELGPTPEQELAPERFVLAHFTGDTAGGDARLKALGRWLRESPPARGVPLALRWVARMANDDRGADAQWKRWLSAISSWLEHRPVDEVGRSALALGQQDLGLGSQLIFWATEHCPSAFKSEPWLELQHYISEQFAEDLDDDGPGGFLSALEAMARELGPGGIEEMMEQMMGSMGRGPGRGPTGPGKGRR